MIGYFKKYAFLILISFTFSCTNTKQEPFTFIQLCDTQLGMGGYDHDIKTFEMAVTQINALDPDFVIICGDLVNDASDSTYADFKKIKNKFNMPCYNVSGNHDVGNIPTDSTLNFYRKTIGQDYYKFKNKGYTFIVTNTQLWKENIPFESEKHDTWFKTALKMNPSNKQSVFVAGHIPLFLKTPDEEDEYFNLPIEKRKELLDLFTQNNVVAYLSGHAHRPIINNYEGIQLVSGEATSKNLDSISDLGFRVWKVSTESISQSFTPLTPPLNESPRE